MYIPPNPKLSPEGMLAKGFSKVKQAPQGHISGKGKIVRVGPAKGRIAPEPKVVVKEPGIPKDAFPYLPLTAPKPNPYYRQTMSSDGYLKR